MQIPILSGIFTDEAADFRTGYPVNLVPVPKESGIAAGYLRPGDGLVQFATGIGLDRGGIFWEGALYRVSGTSLIEISSTGTVTTLGTIPGADPVTFDYSFDRLAIAGGGNLYYWDGATLTQVTDPDLGIVLDVIWVDGYFMTTDGEFLVVTDLTNPLAVNPLKYGTAEADPDPVIALLKIRNEVYAVNRHTIEVFDNVGGDFFPFARIEGAQIEKGALGTYACCVFAERIALLGGGFNEGFAIWSCYNASAIKISTREIEQILENYSETTLANAVLEQRIDKTHQHLYVHLPDRTLVYDQEASRVMGRPVWFILTTAVESFSRYRARGWVYAYDKWIAGDPTSALISYASDTVSSHFGSVVRWEFGAAIVYNDAKGAIFHRLELIPLTGRVALGADPLIWTSYSINGLTWSQPRYARAGKIGDYGIRVAWLQQGFMRNWRIQRFQGSSDAHISIARLEATLEGLAY